MKLTDLFPISGEIVFKFALWWMVGSVFSATLLQFYEYQRTPDDNLWRVTSEDQDPERVKAREENVRLRRKFTLRAGLSAALLWYAFTYAPWIFTNPHE